MQKKLIALAIAGLSGAAFAQSNVTIYGTVDGSWESVSASGANNPGNNAGTNTYASRTRIATNSSLLGFKGTETVGNGTSVVWQVENQLSLDGPAATTTNTQSMGNGWNTRDTYVGLTGSGGTALIGYFSTFHRSVAAKFDVMPGATGAGSSLNTVGRVNTGAVYAAALAGQNTFSTTTVGGQNLSNNIGTIFRSQAIAYVTPKFNGFSAGLAYVPNENRDNTAANAGAVQKNPKGWNAAVNYDNGPLAAGLSYLKLKDIGALTTTPPTATFTGQENNTAWLLGASYAFGPNTKAYFMYDNFKGRLGLRAGGDGTIKRNVWYVGVKQDFGANTVRAYYSKIGDNSVGGGLTPAAGRSFGDDGASAFALRYSYNLSKRTEVYGIYTKISNKTNGNYDFVAIDAALPSGTGGGSGVINAGADPQVVGVGIRHTF